MTHNKLIKRYADGEQLCCVCQKALPAHETWPGARHPFCGSAACGESLKLTSPFAGQAGLATLVNLYIGPNERKCEGPGCTDFVPQGRYASHSVFFACSGECWVRRHHYGDTLHICACGCGQEVKRRRDQKTKSGLWYVDPTHYGKYLKSEHAKSACGVFLPIVEEFYNGFAKRHYREYYTTAKIAPLFEFLHYRRDHITRRCDP